MQFRGSTQTDGQMGWFCSCGYRILPAQPKKKSAHERLRALTERRAQAFRKSMKLRAHAQRLVKKSQRLTAQRRKK
jgi:hypothetical protein